jgi:hypothetical protein
MATLAAFDARVPDSWDEMDDPEGVRIGKAAADAIRRDLDTLLRAG